MDSTVASMIERYGVTPETRRFLAKEQKLYIAGRFVSSASGKLFDVFEPSTTGRLTACPLGNEHDADAAVEAARNALRGPWGSLKPSERERMILRLADLVEANAQTIAEIETIDNGKALGPCLEIDVMSSVELLRYMAGWPTKIEGATRRVSVPGTHMVWTVREPIGVVAAIVPWNWPFSMAMWKIAAPLAAGCTIVLKPAQQTPLSMLFFAELCAEAGLPDGVLNIVTGPGATVGERLAGHPNVAKVSFTGSTAVGRSVGKAAGNALKPVTLELGGKSAMVAFEDCDSNAVAQATRASIFFNAGQVCSAGSRLYIHRSRFEETVAAVVAAAESMTLAPGLDPSCDMGPVVSETQYRSILDWIERGKAAGTEVRTGGSAAPQEGWFIKPTVLTTNDNRIDVVQEEIFGPMLVALPFDTDEQALAMANDNRYGLGASVWTRDISRALCLSGKLEAGTVWINAHDLVDAAFPFGGVKESGFGKDLGPEQLALYLNSKTIWAALE